MAESRSILTADFGSVYTRVLLLDVVSGTYRIVARAEVTSTGGFPAGDVTLGLRRAVARIAKVTGRTLMDDEGNVITPEGDNGRGVDVFVATASGGRPLRAVLIGLMPGVSVESGIRATEGTYVNVEEVLSLGQTRDDEDQLNAILITHPDVILVTGGTEGGATDPLKKMLALVNTALSTMNKPDRPALVYAGNSALTDYIQEAFGETTTVYIADNVRPTLRDEDLDSVQYQLSRVFDKYKESQGGGFDVVGEMSTTGLFPTARSYSVVAEYIGKAQETNVAVVDVGSATGTLATYEHRGTVKTTIRTDVGLGSTALGLVQSIDVEAIRRWVPYSVARADLMNYAMNKQLRPATVPQTRKQMYMEHALLRAGIEDMMKIQRPVWANDGAELGVIIGSGSPLTATGNPGITAMLMLDALQPEGATELYTDPNGVITAMGALAYNAPEAVVQLLDETGLEFIGTAFCVNGSPNVQRPAVKYRIEYDDDSVEEDKIDGGVLTVIDLPPGKTATVKVWARGGVRLGSRRSITRQVKGSLAGIIIDTRGRPIPLGLDLQRRMLQLMVWYSLTSGTLHEEMTNEELEPVEEREMIVSTGVQPVEEETPRRGRKKDKDAPAVIEEADEATIQEILEDADLDDDELERLFEGDEDDFDELLR